MTRLDGRFLKPGSIPADRLDPGIAFGGELADGSVTTAKLADTLLQRFVVVTWGAVNPVDPHTQTVRILLRDLAQNAILAAHVLRITCDERAILSVGGIGQALSGDQSPDLIAQTNTRGRLDLLVICREGASITLAAGPTQASPFLDTQHTKTLTFP